MEDQIQKTAVCPAFFLSPVPRLREIRLEPPMPNRLASPVRKMNMGIHKETAAT